MQELQKLKPDPLGFSIVCSGCTLTFGTKSESSRACSDVCETPTGTESKSAARGRIETPLKRSAFRYFELS